MTPGYKIQTRPRPDQTAKRAHRDGMAACMACANTHVRAESSPHASLYLCWRTGRWNQPSPLLKILQSNSPFRKCSGTSKAKYISCTKGKSRWNNYIWLLGRMIAARVSLDIILLVIRRDGVAHSPNNLWSLPNLVESGTFIQIK